MVNRERKLVPQEIASLYIDGERAVDVIKELQGHVDTYGDSVVIDKTTAAYSDHEYIAVSVMVVEDDKQYARRIEQEEDLQTQRENRDRAEFQRLQAKFGNK